MKSYFGKLRDELITLKTQVKMRGLADFLVHSDFSLASIDEIIEALENPNKTVRVEILVIDKGKDMTFSALDAKKLSDATVAADDDGMRLIFESIKRHAKEGRNRMTYSVNLLRAGVKPASVVESLRAAGYKAQIQFDSRDGDYFEISW